MTLEELKELVEKNTKAIERNAAAIEAYDKYREAYDERFKEYRQATQLLTQLAFTLIASATITVIVTAVIKQF